MVEHSSVKVGIIRSILHGGYICSLGYFPLQPVPVVPNLSIKGCGMCCPICRKVHIQDPLLLIRKSSLCGNSMWPIDANKIFQYFRIWFVRLIVVYYGLAGRITISKSDPECGGLPRLHSRYASKSTPRRLRNYCCAYLCSGFALEAPPECLTLQTGGKRRL